MTLFTKIRNCKVLFYSSQTAPLPILLINLLDHTIADPHYFDGFGPIKIKILKMPTVAV